MTADEEDEIPRSQVAYERLFDAIQVGALAPGTRIREAEIATRFGISRTPVREAIRQLENEGLIVHVPRQGAVIKSMDQREIVELYEMRVVLEGTAARMAAQHASELELSELVELNALMREGAGDDQRVADANRRFHDYLYQAAKNRYLVRSVTALANALAVLGGTTLRGADRVESAFAEHQAILDGIRARDPEQAEAAARAHIQQAQRVRMRLQREAALKGTLG